MESGVRQYSGQKQTDDGGSLSRLLHLKLSQTRLKREQLVTVGIGL